MHLSQLFTRRSAVRAFVTVAMAFPLLGASDCGLSSLTGEESAKYDGTYTLMKVAGQNLPYQMAYVDSRNHLYLVSGSWTLSGTTLTTTMKTTSTINGASTTSTERHVGTVTFSGETATGTLDSGSSVSTTFKSGTMVTSNSGIKMEFQKN